MDGIFKRYAGYYNLIYRDKDYKKECDFLEEVFDHFSKIKPKLILDVGCGTGKHSILLAKRGYTVAGIDQSDEMINIAKIGSKVAGVNIDFYNMTMQDINLDQKFDAAICMFSTIDYLLTPQDIKKALKSIQRCLKKNALFIFDFWNGHAVLASYSPLRIKKSKDKDKNIIRISKTELDADNQLCKIEFECSAYVKNRMIDKFKEKHILRFFTVGEINNYLIESGFEILKICPFLNVDGKINKKTWNISVITTVK